MKYPTGYAWLGLLGPLPRVIQEGLPLVGVQEVVGKGSNKTIVGWRDELNQNGVPIVGYSDDDIPWCGLFAAIVAHRAGKSVVASPLWARNWAKFGNAVARNAGTDAKPHLQFLGGLVPSVGDVLVFVREGGGHVGFYVAEDAGAYHVLGGNQGNRVSITRIAKDRCIAVRRPSYSLPPASLRPYSVAASGSLSKDES